MKNELTGWQVFRIKLCARVGAAAGLAKGAAIGGILGPPGVIVGAIAGAALGAWAGAKAGESGNLGAAISIFTATIGVPGSDTTPGA